MRSLKSVHLAFSLLAFPFLSFVQPVFCESAFLPPFLPSLSYQPTTDLLLPVSQTLSIATWASLRGFSSNTASHFGISCPVPALSWHATSPELDLHLAVAS